MKRVIEFFFGCHHDYSRVFTLRPIFRRAHRDYPEAHGPRETYQVCVNCGHKRLIDWQSFGMVADEEIERRVEVESL
jgi:hypothetical protein